MNSRISCTRNKDTKGMPDLIHDRETNVVYVSALLKYKDQNPDPSFYKCLTSLFKDLGIEYRTLRGTEDYWVRDYMPVQLGKDEFVKYVYDPDYLKDENDPKRNKKLQEYKTDCVTAMKKSGIKINCKSTKLVIDGGNMVPCGPYIVMTDKVYEANGKNKNNPEFTARLESELGHPVIIIPWQCHGRMTDEGSDVYGHSDGFLKWWRGNRVLMGNHRELYPDEDSSSEADAIRTKLEEKGIVVTEMRFKDKVANPNWDLNWAYINFLQVGKNIIMPSFGIEEDDIAERYINESFPDCTISRIEMSGFAAKGGALHCLSWNILV